MSQQNKEVKKSLKSSKANAAPKDIKKIEAKKTATKKKTAKSKNKIIKPVSALTILANETISKENKMTKVNYDYDKISKEAADAGKQQYDAFSKSCSIWSKGSENLFQTFVTICQEASQRQNKAMQSLIECKSINEITEAQTKLVQSNLDDAMANATKLSEISVKLATEAFEPINDQINKSVKKASKAA